MLKRLTVPCMRRSSWGNYIKIINKEEEKEI